MERKISHDFLTLENGESKSWPFGSFSIIYGQWNENSGTYYKLAWAYSMNLCIFQRFYRKFIRK